MATKKTTKKFFGGIIVIDLKKAAAVKSAAVVKIEGVASKAGDKAGTIQRKIAAAIEAAKTA